MDNLKGSTPGQERDEILKAGCSRVIPQEETETWTQLETVHEGTLVLMGGHSELGD